MKGKWKKKKKGSLLELAKGSLLNEQRTQEDKKSEQVNRSDKRDMKDRNKAGMIKDKVT